LPGKRYLKEGKERFAGRGKQKKFLEKKQFYSVVTNCSILMKKQTKGISEDVFWQKLSEHSLRSFWGKEDEVLDKIASKNVSGNKRRRPKLP